jgi:hypothetical protein
MTPPPDDDTASAAMAAQSPVIGSATASEQNIGVGRLTTSPPATAVRRDADPGQPGVSFDHQERVEIEVLQRADTRCRDDDVGVSDKPLELVASGRVVEVESDEGMAVVQQPVQFGVAPPGAVWPAGAFHGHDVHAGTPQQPRAQRARP